eukprot:CAMPEP_0183411020 /NCGR_PEP_ID=MMETSP0370-20130417/20002_1 /TAXON_ID=268820 /ORGANISM="Peridinium aciculiferum, Strain PAER-2" /LENGTH=268 /DNA_ID=CAMNT_0025593931 /DNA_START=125 /DNA_END=930 /DNA_ORIENTATION=-
MTETSRSGTSGAPLAIDIHLVQHHKTATTRCHLSHHEIVYIRALREFLVQKLPTRRTQNGEALAVQAFAQLSELNERAAAKPHCDAVFTTKTHLPFSKESGKHSVSLFKRLPAKPGKSALSRVTSASTSSFATRSWNVFTPSGTWGRSAQRPTEEKSVLKSCWNVPTLEGRASGIPLHILQRKSFNSSSSAADVATGESGSSRALAAARAVAAGAGAAAATALPLRKKCLSELTCAPAAAGMMPSKAAVAMSWTAAAVPQAEAAEGGL